MQKLYTKAGRELVGVPWQRYPRPQLVREDWLCLNGEWELGFEGKSMPIRVPFCPESLLSGVETPPKPATVALTGSAEAVPPPATMALMALMAAVEVNVAPDSASMPSSP